jgi:general secretion pathway protein D
MEKIPVVTIPATPLPAATVPLSLSFRPPATPVAAGSAFQIPILLNGGVDVAAVPMQITYDPALLSLVNVAGGDLLSRDGQALAVVHRDEGPGTITLNVSRPPGAKGISGSGVVCLLNFQAKKPGAATLVITRPTALNSAQQPLAATGGRIQLQVK